MKPPRQIQVGPHRYRVEMSQEAITRAKAELEDNELMGRHLPKDLQITLSPEQAPDNIVGTLLHEILHAIVWTTGLSGDLTKKEEERFVSALEPALLDLLRRNPRLVAYLTTEDSSG